MSKKLVRDKIHEIYKFRPMHVAEDKEYEEELIKKLDEEVSEFKQSFAIEELADIIEVAYAISEFRGVSTQELEKIRRDKANKRGKFKKRVIFDELSKEEPQEDSEESE